MYVWVFQIIFWVSDIIDQVRLSEHADIKTLGFGFEFEYRVKCLCLTLDKEIVRLGFIMCF